MALDESKFNTMKFMRCRHCGNVYAASLLQKPECPDCSSGDAAPFRPDDAEDGETGKGKLGSRPPAGLSGTPQ